MRYARKTDAQGNYFKVTFWAENPQKVEKKKLEMLPESLLPEVAIWSRPPFWLRA